MYPLIKFARSANTETSILHIKAKEILLKAGFSERNITIKIEDKKKGIAARGIINEANAGYDTIVLGRRGLSGIKEFFLGSVPLKVLHSAGNMSVLVVN